jgi:hypothetical protein
VSGCLFFLERFLKRRDWDDGLAGSGLLYQSRDELQGKLYSVVT